MYIHKNADDLTEEEIRNLLSAKLRSASQKRLECFRQTGRLVELSFCPRRTIQYLRLLRNMALEYRSLPSM